MLGVRREAHVNNFMYNRLKRKALVDDRNSGTRAHDAPMFKVSIPKNEAYKRSSSYAGAVQWNKLPSACRNIDNFEDSRPCRSELWKGQWQPEK